MKRQEGKVISSERKTSATGHEKHISLKRPYGNFGRNEWAIVGAHCTQTKALADNVIKALSPLHKCGYADAVHNDAISLMPGRLANGACIEYTDQLNYGQFNYAYELDAYKHRQLFAGMDVVLVNGNHHQAAAQVVVVDNTKRASLLKRLNQLTNVQLILLADGTREVFDFVQDALPNWRNIPLYRFNETARIISFFESKLQQKQPILNGLVLAGGKSTRMGHDKAAINWHGTEQRYYIADLLRPFCEEVFISCSAGQKHPLNTGYPVLEDTFTGLGPYGAILSAFRQEPEKAWLVVACDLPLLDAETLRLLVEHRSMREMATAFNSPGNDFPEPLITIWEPKSYPVLLSFLAQGYSCPRKVLINNEVNLLRPHYPEALTNVNTPEELKKAQKIIHQREASV